MDERQRSLLVEAEPAAGLARCLHAALGALLASPWLVFDPWQAPGYWSLSGAGATAAAAVGSTEVYHAQNRTPHAPQLVIHQSPGVLPVTAAHHDHRSRAALDALLCPGQAVSMRLQAWQRAAPRGGRARALYSLCAAPHAGAAVVQVAALLWHEDGMVFCLDRVEPTPRFDLERLRADARLTPLYNLADLQH